MRDKSVDPDRDAMGRWRTMIDALDRAILDRLNERARCSLAIGEIKKRLGMPVYDPRREAECVRNVLEANAGPLEDPAIRRLFERIIDESRRLERIATDRTPPDGPEEG